MMMLEQFTVENFKAFKSLTLDDLGHINIFVGDNNVGKTCLLHGLALSHFVNEADYPFRAEQYSNEILKFHHDAPFNTLFYKLQINNSIKLETKDSTLVTIKTEDSKSQDSNNLANQNSLEICSVKGEITLLGTSPIYGEARYKIDKSSFDVCKKKEYYSGWTWEWLPTDTDYKQLSAKKYKHFVDENLEAEEKITNVLKCLESRLKDIRYTIDDKLQAKLTIGLTGMPKRLPLESMGDGFAKLLGLACCLEQESSKYLCIDEPENGFHYKTQTSFWKLLANWSLEGDKQSFIATHSYELISCLNDLLTADESLLKRGLKVRVHQLKRDETDPEKINVKTINEEGLDWLLAHEMEIR